MVGEANAAIEGAFAGGATEVLVNDSHGGMFNLTPEDIDPRAVLLQGQKPWSMVAGAGPDAGFEVALFVGYHTRAGHPTGTIAHTYSGAPTLTTLQGRPVGEAGSTRWRSARGACRSGSSAATTSSPSRPRRGSRGPSASS